MHRRFHKMHGLGNDFVVIDAREKGFAFDTASARAVADRRTGVGCDQLIVVGPAARADVSMRIWNADGSEVEACGNATRCVAQLLGHDCTIETAAGLLSATFAGGGVTVDMGEPRFEWDAIPLAYAMDTADLPTAWGPLEHGLAVNLGNPHIVFFVQDIAVVPLGEFGPEIEADPLFPARVNISIAQPINRSTVQARTWERGAGLTRACGTGACAVGVAAIARRIADAPVTVRLPGGDLVIDWRPGGHVHMTGPAAHVFTGELPDALLAA